MKRSFINETPFYHGANSSSFRFAKENRREATFAEQILWKELKSRKLGGYKFRRQHPFDDIILDFYCHELRLAIEVDGGYHHDSSTQERDHERDKKLAKNGIKTIRFTNKEVLYQIQMVRDEICQNFPSPAGESLPRT